MLEQVHAWLEHHGIPPSAVLTKHAGSRLTLIGVPVSRANDLLGASYQLYYHAGTNETVLRTLSYELPEALHEHVQTIVPTTHFGFPRASWQKSSMRPDEETMAPPNSTAEDSDLGTSLSRRQINTVTPDILRWLYKTSAYVPTAADRNVLGVAGFKDLYPSPRDLMQFMKLFRTDGTYATYTVILVNGGSYNPNAPHEEPNLDVQTSFGIAYPIRLIFYSIGSGDAFARWLEYMLDQAAVPQTITISYGNPESQVSPEYATYVCNLFAQIGARGASVIVSSGDDGVGEGKCLFNDGRGNSYVQFTPTFPSTCACRFVLPARMQCTVLNALAGPWVTSVGGTTGAYPEVAAKISGGGFSLYFPRPPYQDLAVPTFLQNIGSQYYGLFKSVRCCQFYPFNF